MNEQKIELSLNLVNAILGYLGKQPYEQVVTLIAAIQQEAQANKPDKTSE